MDHSQHAASIFNKYAETYEERFMDVTMYAESLDFLLKEINNKSASLLDVACGPANISKYLLNRNSQLNIEGIDLAENMLSLAKKNIPNGNFSICDARNLISLQKNYNVIISGFCFPYLTKEEVIQFILDASKCLLPKGLLFLSTMEKPYSESGLQKGSKGDGIMMHFHEGEYLNAALTTNNFEVLLVDRVITEMTTGERVVDLCMVARSGKQEA